jgi:hypothetical protein
VAAGHAVGVVHAAAAVRLAPAALVALAGEPDTALPNEVVDVQRASVGAQPRGQLPAVQQRGAGGELARDPGGEVARTALGMVGVGVLRVRVPAGRGLDDRPAADAAEGPGDLCERVGGRAGQAAAGGRVVDGAAGRRAGVGPGLPNVTRAAR